MKILEPRTSNLEPRTSHVTRNVLRACLLFALIGTTTAMGWAQPTAISPTTTDETIYSSYTGCSGACDYYYANMGTGSDPFVFLYANTGACKFEISGPETWIGWVTDHELNSGVHKRGIACFEEGTNASDYTELLDGNSYENVWDPDVVYINDEDQLLSVYYTIDYDGSESGIPGNGVTNASKFKVRIERFEATDPPALILGSDQPIQVNPNDEIEYVKTPNVDANLNGDACMVWEEQAEDEPGNHIYARIYDISNGLSSNYFDIDPDDFSYFSLGYKYFYNPDVVVMGGPDADGSEPVLITFMARDDYDQVHLMLYTSTIDEVRDGDPTTSSGLSVVEWNIENSSSMPKLTDHPKYEHFSRPRIAVDPASSTSCPSYGIALSEFYPNTMGSNIILYSQKYNGGCYSHQHDPTFGSASLDCAINYEPAIAVNDHGYDIVWSHDASAYMVANWGGNTPVNGTCSPPLNPSDNVVIRINTDEAVFPDATGVNEFSIVPYDEDIEGNYAPSIAYDPQRMFSLTTDSPNDVSQFYGFHFPTGGSQETFYKLSQYSNASLKRGISEKEPEMNPDNTLLLSLANNRWEVQGLLQEATAQLMDMHGRKAGIINVKKTDPKSQSLEIDLSSEASGVYILNIESDHFRQTHKLVVVN